MTKVSYGVLALYCWSQVERIVAEPAAVLYLPTGALRENLRGRLTMILKKDDTTFTSLMTVSSNVTN